MKRETFATHGFALFCFLTALYLSLGGWFQYRYGLWGVTLSEVVFLLIPSLLYTKLLGFPWKKYLPIHQPSWKEFLIILLLTALVIAPVEMLVHLQEQIWPLPEVIQTFYENLVERKTWQQGLLQLFALVLIPAVCEEIFFRGLLQSMLEKRFGKVKSILITALFFAVAHVNPWYFIYYFILGTYFGWIRCWRDNLSLCILAHMLNNLYSLYA